MPYTVDSPIRVVDYDPVWARTFERYSAVLRAACGSGLLGIEHIGSTSVPGLAAKPVIDIGAYAADAEACLALVPAIESAGWTYKPDAGVPGCWYFNSKRPDGVHLAHLHLYPVDHADGWRQRRFRDYLIAHPEALARYAALKRANAAAYPDNIDEYIGAKSAFIRQIYREIDGLGPEQVSIVDSDAAWPVRFEAEAERLRAACGELVLGIEHIGSTSVPGLAAVPVVDIMAVVPSYDAARALITPVEMLGYYYFGQDGIAGRHFFKLEASQQTTVVQLQMVEAASAEARDYVRFREYLRSHRGASATYGALKRGIAGQDRDDEAAYTEAKAQFIRSALDAGADS